MPTILKSFQYSVLFHLALGALFVLSISKVDRSDYQTFQNKIRINLIGLKAGPGRGENSNILGHKEIKTIANPVKKNSYKTSEMHTDSRTELSENLVGSGSASSGASLANGSGGGGSSDFNENILNYYEPQYPKAALRRGLQGELKVKILIGTQGVPLETQILQSSGHKILDDSALEAVRKWVFKTKTNNTYYVVKTIIFQIKT
ncbi:MAG: energy transducer TonB [Bacteriovoracaceae bacterium]|nr:energy transducer TonB [Bacteriovoracaceae bacterium]